MVVRVLYEGRYAEKIEINIDTNGTIEIKITCMKSDEMNEKDKEITPVSKTMKQQIQKLNRVRRKNSNVGKSGKNRN